MSVAIPSRRISINALEISKTRTEQIVYKYNILSAVGDGVVPPMLNHMKKILAHNIVMLQCLSIVYNFGILYKILEYYVSIIYSSSGRNLGSPRDKLLDDRMKIDF